MLRCLLSCQGLGKRLAALLPAAALIMTLVPSAAQVPSSPADALSQLQQYRQQNGAATANQPAVPQDVVIQPVQRENQVQLPPSRLEQILSARAGARLQQFGYDQMGSGRAVTVPQTGAVQDDYVLGPSDEIVVSLRGQENGEYRVAVDRNGQVVLPRLNPIGASGRTFGDVRRDIEDAVRRTYLATSAYISVGRVRQIAVSVSGEVNYPGQRLVTGLSSVVDALLVSGGVRKTGSLRQIRVLRAGREHTIDLYGILSARSAAAPFRLADGDRIVVPPLGRTVAVSGLVRHPGIFELAAGQSSMPTSTLLSLAGGQELRGRYRLSVLRINAQGASDMEALPTGNGVVRDSEILFVQMGADQTVSQATLSGGTGLAGAYPIVASTKLSEVLRAPGALGNTPYTPFGLIVRKDPVTLMPVLISFTPVAVLAGREDQQLASGDVIRVLSAGEFQLLSYSIQKYIDGLAAQQNAIRNPLSQKNNADNSLANVLATKSGQSAQVVNVSSIPPDVQRQQVTAVLDIAPPGTPLGDRQAEKAKAELRADQQAALGQRAQGPNGVPTGQQDLAGAGGVPMVPPMPFQQGQQGGGMYRQDQGLDQNQNPDQAYQQQFQQNGRPGDYQPLPARNYTDQAVDTDRFATNREVQNFGQLARQLAVDPLILMNFLVDSRMRIDGAVRGPGYYLIGSSATLDDVVRAAGGTINWADESGVELISTAIDRQTGRSMTQRVRLPLHQGALASYVVRPGDQIRFGQVFTDVGVGSVTVQGEVRFAGTFPIIRGEHLSELLTRAGGLTNVAYPYGTVFLRQSAAQVEREGYTRAANEVQNQLVVAMTRVGNNKIDPGTFASMQTFVQELRNQQALGRISIVADPSVLASNPAQDPLLEPGDVIYIPQRPSTVSVLGQVLQPGSYPFKAGESVGDYIQRAGGYASTADESQTFVVLPDGSARRVERSWLSFKAENLPPGSAIVVPRDVTPLDLRQTIIDVSQIFSQFAVAIASVAVLSKQ